MACRLSRLVLKYLCQGSIQYCIGNSWKYRNFCIRFGTLLLNCWRCNSLEWQSNSRSSCTPRSLLGRTNRRLIWSGNRSWKGISCIPWHCKVGIQSSTSCRSDSSGSTRAGRWRRCSAKHNSQIQLFRNRRNIIRPFNSSLICTPRR